jgi:hypothetical protein
MIRKILNYILKNKLKALTEKDLINWANADDNKRKIYIEQAKEISKLKLYKDIMKHLKASSQEMMFTKSKSWEDMYFGKAMLYNIDLIEQFIETLSKKNLNK